MPDHGIRTIKDSMTREIVRDFAEAGIEIASTTIAIVQAPPIRVER